jgi:endonuclease/exonuclease/phosphatase family metal-dependent hydrolase
MLLAFLCFMPVFLDAQLTVISFNIRYDNPNDSLNAWTFRKGSLIAFMKNQNPDILSLQEVLHHQLLDVDSLLNVDQPAGVEYAWIGVGREDGKEAGEYCPIFYNKKQYKVLAWETRWLSPTSSIPSTGWDAALPRIATIAKFQEFKSKREFVVINTHLDHLGEQARLNSAKLIVTWLDTLAEDGTPVLLMGDFNGDRKSSPIRWINASQRLLIANDMKTTFPRGTFNGFRDSVTSHQTQRGPEIDFIFYSNHFNLLSSTVDYTQRGPGLFLSDHFPVIAKFENSIPSANISICSPIAWTVQKIRVQVEFPLSEKKSIGVVLTIQNVLWQTQSLGLEYRYFPTVRRNSKLGYYGNVTNGFGKADHYGNGIYSAISGGFIQQKFSGKNRRWLFEIQFGGRAGVMLTGDLESGGGFGGLLYIAGPLSIVDFRMNMGYRF